MSTKEHVINNISINLFVYQFSNLVVIRSLASQYYKQPAEKGLSKEPFFNTIQEIFPYLQLLVTYVKNNYIFLNKSDYLYFCLI